MYVSFVILYIKIVINDIDRLFHISTVNISRNLRCRQIMYYEHIYNVQGLYEYKCMAVVTLSGATYGLPTTLMLERPLP